MTFAAATTFYATTFVLWCTFFTVMIFCSTEYDLYTRFERIYNIYLQREKDEFKIESTLTSIGLYQKVCEQIEAE